MAGGANETKACVQPLVRALTEADRVWQREFLTTHFASPTISSRRKWIDTMVLPGFVAWRGESRVGIAMHTEMSVGAECELVALATVSSRGGVGSALLASVTQAARAARCSRLVLTTSNDNLDAMRLYQRRGWRFVRVYPGAMDDARREKPEIPAVGAYGIPMRDDVEFEYDLSGR
ncbi:MAG: GNAT family N-acetyltransferase [Phycisphaeraceae bacterium]|nr:GNAT family N-acetyltransferase [Phycisphaeraceae bacterium]